MRPFRTLVLAFVLAATPVEARTAREMFAEIDKFTEAGIAVLEGLSYEQGPVAIDKAGVRLDVPASFYFLNAVDAANVLVSINGNAVIQTQGVVGMITPTKYTPIDADRWQAVLIYEADGHVGDADAGTIDFGGLLPGMRAELEADNVGRQRLGYDPARLVGWAVPPAYDPRSHTLTWALELAYAGRAESEINYSVRVLGRTGVLRLNIIAGKRQLSEVRAVMPSILKMVSFIPGARYEDFNAATDTSAPYSIAQLISGKADPPRTLWTRLGEWALRGFLIALALVGIGAGLLRLRNRHLRPAGPPKRRI